MIDLKDTKVKLSNIELSSKDILNDYRIAYRSRQASLLGRKEVMGGKAKFGIFGGGKEVAQLAMARAFRKGDFRSGYYRDQTFMLALGEYNLYEFFAQLYANPELEADPATAGRCMNSHFATRSIDDAGNWNRLMGIYNTSADISPTGGQMPRLVGLAYASRLYREMEDSSEFANFTNNGDEIAFGTIGNASCAEGMFWESLNAVGVLKSPMLLSIWDDDYGISVSNEYQITKQDLSQVLQGFQREAGSKEGFDLYRVRGWDYAKLIETYQEAAEIVRREHVPAIIHVVEITQPQGHSTSGSHERYKSKERLQWERDHDCLLKMRQWMLEKNLIGEADLRQIEEEELAAVEQIRTEAWKLFQDPIRKERETLMQLIDKAARTSPAANRLIGIRDKVRRKSTISRHDLMIALRDSLLALRTEGDEQRQALIEWRKSFIEENRDRYGSHLFDESGNGAIDVPVVPASYSEFSPSVNGFELLNACFDAALSRLPQLVAFGEDVGQLGDVNQGFKGLQAKYGVNRVTDTGIRECTIMGQAIGLAMRGFRPIAEIQYLDYILYALQLMSDDLATLHWRTKGGQRAPVIIRTRGHRLEGIWHSGSPMAGILNLVRGIHVLVPRNMTQAAGFYNTLLQAQEPGLVVEVLNGYRLKEQLPDNVDEFTVPLGVPEILREGSDVTLVTYGACCRVAMEAAEFLADTGIETEVIDVQSLLPFDLNSLIRQSIEKTSRVIFVDEDVPGGATAYMMQEVLEKQGGYWLLDSEPRTLAAAAHRPAYGSDGDYWSKPSVESIFETVYEMMHEGDPAKYPLFYR